MSNMPAKKDSLSSVKGDISSRSSIEVLFGFLWFAFLIHLLTRSGVQHLDLAVAFALCMGMVFLAVTFRKGKTGPLYSDLSAMALGFWSFSMFRFIGLVSWPMGCAGGGPEFFILFYSHVVMAVSVAFPLLAVRAIRGDSGKTTGVGFESVKLNYFILLTAICLFFWGYAGWRVFFSGLGVSSLSAGIVLICLLKAALTGVAEEFCYRGVLLRDSEKICGTGCAIVIQAVFYTLFHMHLGAAFYSPPLFLTGVFALGIFLGIVTRLTRGIGFAVVIHTAIGVMIEWDNLDCF